MVRRTRTEVIVDILDAGLKGTNKTRIMYKANLNFLSFKRYLKELARAGLLEVVDNPGDEYGRVVYRTSKKGRELLETLRTASEIIPL